MGVPGVPRFEGENMIIDLKCGAPDRVTIRVNGRTACEIAACVADDRDTLEAEVAAARRLESLRRAVLALPRDMRLDGFEDHVNRVGRDRLFAYAQGLRAGLDGDTIPHGLPGVPPIPPRSDPSYLRGWEAGKHLRECCT